MSIDNLKEALKDDYEILGVDWVPGEKVEEILKINKNIKWIHFFTAGIDSLMTPAIKKYPCIMTNSKGAYSESLGEWIAFGMLWFSKNC